VINKLTTTLSPNQNGAEPQQQLQQEHRLNGRKLIRSRLISGGGVWWLNQGEGG